MFSFFAADTLSLCVLPEPESGSSKRLELF